MKNVYKIIFLFLFVMVLLAVNANSSTIEMGSYTFEKSTVNDLKIGCFENNTFCGASTSCQITINAPNGTNLVKNQSMTYNDNYFNYTVNESNVHSLGTYGTTITCQGITESYLASSFEVTGSGTQPTTAQGILYSLFLVISIFLLVITLIGAVTMDGNDEFDAYEGSLLKINWKKYVKMGLYWMSYQFFVFFMFMSWQVAYRFLIANFISEMFRIFFLILLICEAPLFLAIFYYMIVKIVADMELQKILDRGEQPR